MYDFNFSLPTKIYFGKGKVDLVGDLTKSIGSKVLLLYGSDRIFKNGLGNKILDLLEKSNCQVILKGGVNPNADICLIREAIELSLKEKIDCILAVGGGSVIDSAKAIAAGIYYEGDVSELYFNTELEPSKYVPIGTVVTVAGTASESNNMSIISDSDKKLKLGRFCEGTRPKFAILDPELTLTVPTYQTAVGGFDMFAHAFERYFFRDRNSELMDGMGKAVMKTILKLIPLAIREPYNLQYRSELMWAATVAHNDMIGAGGDFACHEISHYLTEEYGIPHGEALGIIIPVWCEYTAEYDIRKMAKFFREVFEVKEEGISEKNIVDIGIAKLKAYIKSIGLETELFKAARNYEGKFIGSKADVDKMAKDILMGRESLGFGFMPLYRDDIKSLMKKIV